MKIEFLTPVGRLVQGDPFEAQTKNQQGQPLMTLGGQPTQKYFCAVAFKKDDPGFSAMYQKMVAAARAGWPQFFDAAGNCTNPRFSWKLADGDGVDDNGKPNSSKEGFAGHWVLKFSSSFAPRCFHAGHYQPHEQIQDPKAIPRGYFVRVAGTIEANDSQSKPGIYVNLSMVELVGGTPAHIIQSGPDASAVFGGAPAALPVGASPLPMHTAAMPGFTPPAPVLAAPGLPLPPGSVPSALPATMSLSSPVAVMPNPAFLAAGPSAIPAIPVVPVAPVTPQMTAKAGAATYDQFRAQGWTDEAMRAEGYLV